MYFETSTTELSVGVSSSDTAELKFTEPFGAIRMTMVSTGAAHATNAAALPPSLHDIERILVEIPSRGGLSRRINLSGGEVHMAALVAALGASNADEAATSSSYEMFTGAASESQLADYAYIDLPVGAAAQEEVRITVELGAASAGATFKFTAMNNVANRNLIFDVTSLGEGSRVDHTFRNDVEPFAMIVGSGSTAYQFDSKGAGARADLTEINFDGLPRFTYDDVNALNSELDKVITSTTKGKVNLDTAASTIGRDAQAVDCLFVEIPDAVKKANIEATTTSGKTRWVIVAYADNTGVSA